MSVMERRLQLLIDLERYARVEDEARRSGRSVSAVIRTAIDVAYPGEVEVRVGALRSLLEIGARSQEAPEEAWEIIKESLERDVAGDRS